MSCAFGVTGMNVRHPLHLQNELNTEISTFVAVAPMPLFIEWAFKHLFDVGSFAKLSQQK